MIEWFQSIGQWFVANKDALVTVVTSGNLVGFVANTVLIIKTMFGLKDNTSISTKLQAALVENTELKNEVVSLKDEQNVLKNEVLELKQMVATLIENQGLLITKSNAALDVQSIVYSTLKDANSRTTVQNIIANAKFAEDNKRAKLIEELEELRKKVSDTQQELVQTIEKGVEKAEAIVENKVNVSRC